METSEITPVTSERSEGDAQTSEAEERQKVITENVNAVMARREKRRQDPRTRYTTDLNILSSARELTALSALRGMAGEADPYDIKTQVHFRKGEKARDFDIALIPNMEKGSVWVRIHDDNGRTHLCSFIANGDKQIMAPGGKMIESNSFEKGSGVSKDNVEMILDSAVRTTAVGLGYQGK